MILLDTDIVSLFHAGHERVVARMRATDPSENVATTVITQAEILRARYEFLLKASDAEDLLRAQQRLDGSEAMLADFRIVRIDAASAARFDVLRSQKKLKKIGRADLLIASIALTHEAILVSRNLRHLRQIHAARRSAQALLIRHVRRLRGPSTSASCCCTGALVNASDRMS